MHNIVSTIKYLVDTQDLYFHDYGSQEVLLYKFLFYIHDGSIEPQQIVDSKPDMKYVWSEKWIEKIWCTKGSFENAWLVTVKFRLPVG